MTTPTKVSPVGAVINSAKTKPKDTHFVFDVAMFSV